MPKHISLTFTENGVTARAVLLEDEAPKTCAAIWKALEVPLVNKGIHAMFAGREVMLELPEANRRFKPEEVPQENLTCFPAPGDLLWFYFGPHQERGFPDEIYDLAIFYGRDSRLLLPMGWVPGNHFGLIAENLLEFAKMCERVRTEGLKEIVVKRLE